MHFSRSMINMRISGHVVNSYLRMHWRLSTLLKSSNKSVRSNVFWYVKVCMPWKSIQYTIHLDKTQMLKKLPSEKINGTKKPSFFFRELQLITVLLLTCDFYMSWSTRFVSLKLRVRFSIFDSVPFLLKYIFLFNKMHELFDFKTS